MADKILEPACAARVAEVAAADDKAPTSAGWQFYLAVVVVLAWVSVAPWYAGLRANLATEYVNIGRALAAGEGFAHPFGDRTGPTAWMAPLLPLFVAGLLWISDGSTVAVNSTIVALQSLALAGTGILVLTLARRTTRRIGPLVAAVAFVLGTLAHFRICFQTASLDCWLLLIALDVLLAGLCWAQRLTSGKRAAAWGFFGGVAGLASPVVLFAWGMMTLMLALRQKVWSRAGIALVLAALVLAPWMVRNYLVFGRLIPIKSNLAYELYQSQCLQPTGMLHGNFGQHPFRATGPEGRMYRALGETAYLERKRAQFAQAVWDDPEDFLDRLADRFLGAVVWYEPFNPVQESRHRWAVALATTLHPLPLLALTVLVFLGIAAELSWPRWAAVGVYVLYLFPYIAISYYDRYGMPLLGVKVLLVLWVLDEILKLPSLQGSSRWKRSGQRVG